MAASDNIQDGLKLSDHATLGLLAALEAEEPHTQRSLAARIGVALGLTNSLLKRAIHKGLVKVSQAPAKRFAYYVTPKGFSEKSRLVADYLSTSLSFFRQAKEEYGILFFDLKEKGIDRIVLCGTGELAEIAVLAAHEQDIEIQFIVQRGSNLKEFCGYNVRNNLSTLKNKDVSAVIITSIDAPQDVYNWARSIISDINIHTVPLLHISRLDKGSNKEPNKEGVRYG